MPILLSSLLLGVAFARPPMLPLLALPPVQRVVVIAPHPDDETIAAGGLIRRLTHLRIPVDVIFVTNGDGYPEVMGPHAHPADFVAFGRRRWREALDAVHRLGVHRSAVHFLGFPDGGLAQLWDAHWSRRRPYTSPFTDEERPPYAEVVDPTAEYDGQDLTAVIARLLRDLQPTVVVMPHPADTHPDHAHTSYFVTEAIEKLEADEALEPDLLVLTYLVHDRTWPPPVADAWDMPAPPQERFRDTRWVTTWLSPAERAAKGAALSAHASQMKVMPGLLERFLRPNEVFGRVKSRTLAQIAARH